MSEEDREDLEWACPVAALDRAVTLYVVAEDPVGRALDIAQRAYEIAGRDLSLLPKPLLPVLLVSELECETAVNGLLGWLDNSSGANAVETAVVLEEIGAKQVALLVREALAFFPSSPSKDWTVRREQIARLPEPAVHRIGEIGRAILEWPDDVNALLATQILRDSRVIFGKS